MPKRKTIEQPEELTLVPKNIDKIGVTAHKDPQINSLGLPDEERAFTSVRQRLATVSPQPEEVKKNGKTQATLPH
jgi:hypothetical protein